MNKIVRFVVMLLLVSLIGSVCYAYDNDISGSAFGNKTFVIAGDKGLILYSSNGIKWNRANNNFKETIFNVTFGAGKFVAHTESDKLYYSTNGIDWMPAYINAKSKRISSVKFINNKFIAVGGNSSILASDNGINWESIELNGYLQLNKVAYGNGMYVIDGWKHGDNGIENFILTTPDFKDFKKSQLDKTLFNGVYVNNSFYYAACGFIWKTNDIHDKNSWVDVISGNSAGSLKGASIIATDSYGSMFANMFDINYSKGTFVVVGLRSIIYYSNGKTWNRAKFKNYSDETTLSTVTFGNGKFVAGGQKGLILTSSDGKMWEKIAYQF